MSPEFNAIGTGEGLVDVGVITLTSIAHPIQTMKGTLHAIAHPITTVTSIGRLLRCKGSQLIGDDPRAAGRVIGQAIGGVAMMNVASGATAAGVAGTMKVARMAKYGLETEIGANLRVAPFGNRTTNRLGQLPHYHRRTIDPTTGESVAGQGIKRHRPWERKSTDTGFGDRF